MKKVCQKQKGFEDVSTGYRTVIIHFQYHHKVIKSNDKNTARRDSTKQPISPLLNRKDFF